MVSLPGKVKKTLAVRMDGHLKVGVHQIQRHHLVVLSNGRHDCSDCLHLELGGDNVLVEDGSFPLIQVWRRYPVQLDLQVESSYPWHLQILR